MPFAYSSAGLSWHVAQATFASFAGCGNSIAVARSEWQSTQFKGACTDFANFSGATTTGWPFARVVEGSEWHARQSSFLGAGGAAGTACPANAGAAAISHPITTPPIANPRTASS